LTTFDNLGHRASTRSARPRLHGPRDKSKHHFHALTKGVLQVVSLNDLAHAVSDAEVEVSTYLAEDAGEGDGADPVAGAATDCFGLARGQLGCVEAFPAVERDAI